MYKYFLSLLCMAVVISLCSISHARMIPSDMPVAAIDNQMPSTDIDDVHTFIAERIKLFEGFSPVRYRCSSGIMLQVYGKYVKHSPSRISRQTADRWLRQDIRTCVKQLDEQLPWWRELSTVRQAALIDLTYNMGIYKVLKFKKFLTHMRQGRYELASKELMRDRQGRKSRYARQVGIRAVEISHAISSDVWVPLKEFA